MKMKLKVGDLVFIHSGGQKGKSGKISGMTKDLSRIFIDGLQPVKRHKKGGKSGGQAGSVDLPRSVSRSNVRRAVSSAENS